MTGRLPPNRVPDRGSISTSGNSGGTAGELAPDPTRGHVPSVHDVLAGRIDQERGVKHNEILVSDIMTPLDRLEAIPVEEVRRARVGDIVASLLDTGRQHTLVTEKDDQGKPVVCGIFSLTQIEKQLGVAIPSTEIARTFTEIEATLARV